MILSLEETAAYVGLGRTKIYQLVAEGRFPKPVALTDGQRGRRGWIEAEVREWVRELPRVHFGAERRPADQSGAVSRVESTSGVEFR